MNLIANFAVLASRRTIFDLPVCDLGWDDALVFINELASIPVGQTVVCFVNAHNMLTALRDDEYYQIMSHNLVLPDGIGLNIASQVTHGSPFPANLNGTDFVPAFLQASTRPLTVGLLGATRVNAEAASVKLAALAVQHNFVVIHDGYFSAAQEPEIIGRIAALRPDMLLVAMGVPRQELWIARHIDERHCTMPVAVGALLDFLSGSVPRAPLWMRRMRLEWLFRLAVEPGRLWRRYVVGNPVFLWRVVKQRWSRGAETAGDE